MTKGPNSQLAAELAQAFASRFQAPIRTVTLIERGLAKEEAERQEAEARKTLEAAGLQGDLEVLRRREVARGLAAAVKRGDLVLIGAPSQGPLAAVLGETVPEVIAKRGRNPMVVVREVGERRAQRFERLFFRRS